MKLQNLKQLQGRENMNNKYRLMAGLLVAHLNAGSWVYYFMQMNQAGALFKMEQE